MRRKFLKHIIVTSVALGLMVTKILDLSSIFKQLVQKKPVMSGFVPCEGKSDLAQLADWDQFIKENPNEALAYTHRGSIYSNLKEWKLALADYNKSIQMDPNYSFNYLDRGLIFIELNEKKKAIEDLNIAAQLMKQDNNMPGYQTVGYLLKELES